MGQGIKGDNDDMGRYGSGRHCLFWLGKDMHRIEQISMSVWYILGRRDLRAGLTSRLAARSPPEFISCREH